MTGPKSLQQQARAGSQFATLRGKASLEITNRYLGDAAYRKQCDAEAAHQQAINDAAMDARMIANGTRWPKHWPDEDKQEMTERMKK